MKAIYQREKSGSGWMKMIFGQKGEFLEFNSGLNLWRLGKIRDFWIVKSDQRYDARTTEALVETTIRKKVTVDSKKKKRTNVVFVDINSFLAPGRFLKV